MGLAKNLNADNENHRVLVKALNKSFKKSNQLIDVIKAIQNSLSQEEKGIKHFELVDNEQLIVTLSNKKDLESIISKGSYFKAAGHILQITEYNDTTTTIDDLKRIKNTNKQNINKEMFANSNYLKVDKRRVRIKNLPNIDKDYLELYLNFLAGENEISDYEIRPNENCVLVTFTKEINFEKIRLRHAKKSKVINKSTELLQVYESESHATKPFTFKTVSSANSSAMSKQNYDNYGLSDAYTNKLYTNFQHYQNPSPYSHLSNNNYQIQSIQTPQHVKKIIMNTNHSIPKPNITPHLNYYSMSANNSNVTNNYDSKSIKSNTESHKTDFSSINDKRTKPTYLRHDAYNTPLNNVQCLADQLLHGLDMKNKIKSNNNKENNNDANQKLAASSSSTLNVNKKADNLNMKSVVNLPSLDQPYKILDNAFKNIFKSDQTYHEEKYLQTELINKSEYPISFINNIPVYQLDKNDAIKKTHVPNDVGRRSRNQAKMVRIQGAPPPKLTKLDTNSSNQTSEINAQPNLRFSISDYHRNDNNSISSNQNGPNRTNQSKARARSSNPTQKNSIQSQYGAVTRSEAINKLDKNQIEFFKTSNYLSNLRAKYPNLSINLNETLKQLYIFGSPTKIFEVKSEVVGALGSFRNYEYKLDKKDIVSFLDRNEIKQRISLFINTQLKRNAKNPLDFCAYDIISNENGYNTSAQYHANYTLIIFSNSIENADYLYKYISEIVQSIK